MRARRFDLALQLHGDDHAADALVAAFGAQRCAGRGAAPPPGCEVERLLALTDRLGLARHGSGLDFPLRDADRESADRLCAPLRGQRFAIVHAGGQWPSPRGPVERSAAAADALARDGLAIVLTGSAAETGLTRAVAAAMRAPALDLAGRTTLWSLGALVEWAARVVCDDRGIAHVAAALGTPSVACAPGTGALRTPAPAPRQAPGAAPDGARIAA
jgi:ADP-heptose:LPS heptosyltransferase